MIVKSNLHTHTIYCDGKNTPREIVEEAINRGFVSIGFSGHSYAKWLTHYCMSKENTEKYIKEILKLKAEYRDKIDILLGLEQEYFSDVEDYPLDFRIGSLHGVEVDNKLFPIDDDVNDTDNLVKEYFDGDYYKFIARYYEIIADLPKKTKADIIGHFDLVTKFNDNNRFFDEENPKYLNPALDALDEVTKYNIPFEINTGAVYKGYKKNPYPSKNLLKRLSELGGKIIFSSDSHDVKSLGFGFDDASNLAKECGFKSYLILTKDGFKEENL
jgi:histidinol-phosphatase (PHP family)